MASGSDRDSIGLTLTKENDMSESTFTFNDSGKRLFTIKADGTIERGEGFTTTDEMSLKFWEAVENTKRSLPMTDTKA
jgi:hypothetical protein